MSIEIGLEIDGVKLPEGLEEFCKDMYTRFSDDIKKENFGDLFPRIYFLQLLFIELYLNIPKEMLIKIIGNLLKNSHKGVTDLKKNIGDKLDVYHEFIILKF